MWFTLARGRLTEVFFRSPDRACTRSLGFVVDGIDVAGDAEHAYSWPHEGVPLAWVTSRGRRADYRLDLETIADPRSNVVLQRVRWSAREPIRIACVLEPAIDNHAGQHEAFAFEQRGRVLLGAQRGGTALALACTLPWRGHTRGPDDDAALVGELGSEAAGQLVLALAFASEPAHAAHLALGALTRGYEPIRDEFVAEWLRWSARLHPSNRPLWARSVSVLKTLEAKHVDGGRVAALATPWGASRGPGIAGTYHAVWTRDLVQSIGGLVAAGVRDEGVQALTFLRTTQYTDGHWPQDMLLDGRRLWHHEELDEAALPVLLVDLLLREQMIGERELAAVWPMISRACNHLARTGPSTNRDRWEDTSGVTPFTLAAEIAALATAAALGVRVGRRSEARQFRAVANAWYERVDDLLFRRGGPLADELDIAGYYVRARHPGEPYEPDLDVRHLPSRELSPDALALVRFGLRRPDDPRVRATVRAIDAVLRTELPPGPAWYRYPGDRYGEHRDGSPFDGRGIGRAWPLLAGERAHYELARGDRAAANELLCVLERCANATGMLPEQIWDAADVPAHGLYRGRATGSAAPLGWAHAEYVKLCRGLADDRVFDVPSVRMYDAW